jgi:hypothetical protein
MGHGFCTRLLCPCQQSGKEGVLIATYAGSKLRLRAGSAVLCCVLLLLSRTVGRVSFLKLTSVVYK